MYLRSFVIAVGFLSLGIYLKYSTSL